MSMPPQVIRVKRKLVDESPVTFLQLDQGAKRHRSGSHWVYQRRDAATPKSPTTTSNHVPQPLIHVSEPDDKLSPRKPQDASAASIASRPVARAKSPSRAAALAAGDGLAEPRRFHISRSLLSPDPAQNFRSGINKNYRASPAVFVERTRKKRSQRAEQALQAGTISQHMSQPLKKPTASKRPVQPQKEKEVPVHAPLPPSLKNHHNEDMDKIAADMNQWVLNEIGANLHEMEQEKAAEKAPKFRPKAPAKRYSERHPQPVETADDNSDTAMGDGSEEEGEEGDWVIDEYIRVPVESMALDIAPADVGLLVLDGEEERMLFFGPERDDEDEMLEDDEDENAENYYAADYPEDEVDTDDEYNRQAYLYRTANASDEEEFDNRDYHESDEDEMILEGDDDDATMARIRTYMKRRAGYE
ncbi:hypothetical protein B0I35DRAFT_404422 [Stachybotrys elegans]|uniref:Transcription factor Iwr1 domain-containing protein n=1 Tax=Stachybotrys elegans TaxID=80388 RepID=A0A8K0WWY7_9HYPO|nr:hypothetical protein B0I35DRAFT_404422 [Stachybotrys elegans]